ncbi:MAG: hypothetical protein ABFS86_13140 [Planctomycetota bacterium]
MNRLLVVLIALVAFAVGVVAGRVSGPEVPPAPRPVTEPRRDLPHPSAVPPVDAVDEPPAPAPATEEEPPESPVRHIDRIVREPPPPPVPIPSLYVGSLIHTPNGDLKIVGTGDDYRLVRVGRWITRSASGATVREEEYLEGVLHGAAVHRHESGTVKARGLFVRGRRQGPWEEFDAAGNRVLATVYEAGKIVSVRRFGPGGAVLTDADLGMQAACGGKYDRLLYRFHVPDDVEKYGLFKDFGHYRETDYQDVKGVPAAFWVYVHPYWYVWAEKGE